MSEIELCLRPLITIGCFLLGFLTTAIVIGLYKGWKNG